MEKEPKTWECYFSDLAKQRYFLNLSIATAPFFNPCVTVYIYLLLKKCCVTNNSTTTEAYNDVFPLQRLLEILLKWAGLGGAHPCIFGQLQVDSADLGFLTCLQLLLGQPDRVSSVPDVSTSLIFQKATWGLGMLLR